MSEKPKIYNELEINKNIQSVDVDLYVEWVNDDELIIEIASTLHNEVIADSQIISLTRKEAYEVAKFIKPCPKYDESR